MEYFHIFKSKRNKKTWTVDQNIFFKLSFLPFTSTLLKLACYCKSSSPETRRIFNSNLKQTKQGYLTILKYELHFQCMLIIERSYRFNYEAQRHFFCHIGRLSLMFRSNSDTLKPKRFFLKTNWRLTLHSPYIWPGRERWFN